MSGNYEVEKLSQSEYVNGVHKKNVVYAVQPDIKESGRVWFLGDKYIDRVVRNDETVYSRNYLLNTGSEYTTVGNGASNQIPTNMKMNFSGGSFLGFIPLEGSETVFLADIEVAGNNISGKLKIQTGLNQWNNYGELSLSKEENIHHMVTTYIGSNQVTNKAQMIAPILMNVPNTVTIEIKHASFTLGTVATPYTVAPEDLFPSIQTFPMFPEWQEEITE